MTNLASAARFSDRVDDYVRYRPDYPAAAIEVVVRQLGLAPSTIVADVGAGPGILTRQLVEASGTRAIAIEPNDEMRAAAGPYLDGCVGIEIVDGSAERTGLAAESVDAVTAAQAFHWFDPVSARAELARILKPGGRVALLWNGKRFDSSPLMSGYAQLLVRHAPEFPLVRHEKNGEDDIVAFFDAFEVYEFPHSQHIDWPALLGRVKSSSYAPRLGVPGHDELVAGLRTLFDASQRGGRVDWSYETSVYIGTIG